MSDTDEDLPRPVHQGDPDEPPKERKRSKRGTKSDKKSQGRKPRSPDPEDHGSSFIPLEPLDAKPPSSSNTASSDGLLSGTTTTAKSAAGDAVPSSSITIEIPSSPPEDTPPLPQQPRFPLWKRTFLTLCGEVDQPDIRAPSLQLWKLFWVFFMFGCRAFGGPVAQIAMIKQQLVVEEKWITVEKFNRVLAVYQALPGPEATELACYFGLLCRGRIGAVIAGGAFLVPGFCILLLVSWLYVTYGIENPEIKASFVGVQPAVAALIFRAVLKLADHAFEDQKTKTFSLALVSLSPEGLDVGRTRGATESSTLA